MGGLDEVTVSSAPHTVVHWTRWACQSFVSLPSQHLILGTLCRLATLKLQALGALASLNTICRGKTAIASPRGACDFGLFWAGRVGPPVLPGEAHAPGDVLPLAAPSPKTEWDCWAAWLPGPLGAEAAPAAHWPEFCVSRWPEI